jgi:hypothetical protein
MTIQSMECEEVVQHSDGSGRTNDVELFFGGLSDPDVENASSTPLEHGNRRLPWPELCHPSHVVLVESKRVGG